MSRYKVRNWSQYNESLKNRASLSIWISQDAVKKWKAGKRQRVVGAPLLYSDHAILCMMALKVIYRLPYRQLVGFLASIFSLMRIDLPIPHFTTAASRARMLKSILKKLCKGRPTDLVFDSSGFKIYGEGEWTVRQHGRQQRRRWKKFHIGVCPKSHEIVVAEVTGLEKADCQVVPTMLKKAPGTLKRAVADGAYDTEGCYKSAYEKGVSFLVPPRQGAVLSDGTVPWMKQRDDAISEIIGLGNTQDAIKLWKKLRGYHRRSLVETSFSRFKGCFGPNLFSKNIENQEVELLAKAYVLNEMTKLGMPKGVMV